MHSLCRASFPSVVVPSTLLPKIYYKCIVCARLHFLVSLFLQLYCQTYIANAQSLCQTSFPGIISSSVVSFEELPKLLQMSREYVSGFISEYRCPFWITAKYLLQMNTESVSGFISNIVTTELDVCARLHLWYCSPLERTSKCCCKWIQSLCRASFLVLFPFGKTSKYFCELTQSMGGFIPGSVVPSELPNIVVAPALAW